MPSVIGSPENRIVEGAVEQAVINDGGAQLFVAQRLRHPQSAHRQTKVEMETEWSIRQSIDASAKLQTLQMERADDHHRKLIDSIAQTVEESSAFAQGRKLAERHPFLSYWDRRLFGR
ncbi:hypothetical protein [Variovorax sp. ZS18.2.2]|uniref:hypothetical protein n=1 Tax=Variovorax sp. ZS18.2.2 TaxID=2971255 RepID=UPI0035B05AE5